MYSPIRAAIRRYHRQGGFNNGNELAHSSGGYRSRMKVLSGCISVRPLLLPWRRPASPCPHMASSLGVQRKTGNFGVSSSSYKGTSLSQLRTHPHDHIYSLLPPYKPYLQTQSVCELELQHNEFLGDTLQSSQLGIRCLLHGTTSTRGPIQTATIFHSTDHFSYKARHVSFIALNA